MPQLAILTVTRFVPTPCFSLLRAFAHRSHAKGRKCLIHWQFCATVSNAAQSR
jgi:hypothetical protein